MLILPVEVTTEQVDEFTMSLYSNRFGLTSIVGNQGQNFNFQGMQLKPSGISGGLKHYHARFVFSQGEVFISTGPFSLVSGETSGLVTPRH